MERAYGPGQITHALTLYRHRERRPGLRRRHQPLVLGARHQSRRGQRDARYPAERRPDHPAGDGQSPRRYERSAADAAGRACRRPRRRVTRSRRPRRSSLPSRALFRRFPPSSISGTAADNGGGQVSAVEVSVDGGSTWKRATGLSNWTLQLGDRDRRTRPPCSVARSTTAAMWNSRASSVTVTVGGTVTCPCTIWPSYQAPRRGRQPGCGRPRTWREVPDRHRRLHHRHPVLQERSEHRRPHRQSLDGGRHAAANGHLYVGNGDRLAAGSFRQPGAGHGEHDLRRVVSHRLRRTTRPISTTSRPRASTTGRCTPCRRPSAAGTGCSVTAPPRFRTKPYSATNYWVDVVFENSDRPRYDAAHRRQHRPGGRQHRRRAVRCPCPPPSARPWRPAR